MRISVDINGYYDWVPVTPGTQITEADVAALKVKKMTDEKWHMRATVVCPSDAPSHHDVGLHEAMICQRLAALEKLGRPETREQVAAFMLQESFRHHLAPQHMIKINVHDDGPDVDAYRAALAEQGIVEGAQDEAVARYTEECDMEAYLNTVFKTASTKTKGKK